MVMKKKDSEISKTVIRGKFRDRVFFDTFAQL